MTENLTKYDSLGEAVLSAHSSYLEPRCHKADKIRQLARQALGNYGYYGRAVGNQKIVRTPDYKATLGNVDLDLQVMWPKKFGDLHPMLMPFKLVFGAYERRTFTLAINNDINMPAAIILPPTDVIRSAIVLVGEEVNKPEHLDAILPIVQDMSQGKFKSNQVL